MNIYFCPDLHIGHNIKKTCAITADDSYKALQRLSELVLSDNTDLEAAVVLPGDIFTKNTVAGSDIRAFTNFIDGLYSANIKVYTIQGNHDNNEQSIAAALGAYSLNHVLTDIGGLKVYGLDYMPSDQLKKELSKVPPCDVLVLHAGCFGIVEMQEMSDFTIADIPAHVKNVVSGHIHRSDTFPCRGGLVVSPGVLHPNAIDQSPPYSVFKFDGKIFKQLSIENRELLRIEIDKEESLEEVRQLLQSKYPVVGLLPFVELKFNTELWASIQELKLLFKDKCVFSEKPYSVSKLNEIEFSSEELDRKLTLKDALPFAIDIEQEPGAYSLLSALLDEGDSKDKIKAHIQDRLEG